MRFEPTEDSLRRHVIPDWYHDAKFGIFIHWGLYSVPAYAPPSGKTMTEMQVEQGLEFLKNSPYAEWYLNSMKFKDYPSWQYHLKTYGEDYAYENFQEIFERESAGMNPAEWAELFSDAGARYVVMVTKHHDGYLLWPSEHPNPLKPDYYSKRDLVGEATEAVRAKGLKMGFYYSGVFDWTFIDEPLSGMFSLIRHYAQGRQYADYARSHFLELITKYRPSILWNDIGAPYDLDVKEIQAFFYNHIEDGVTNDRWLQLNLPKDPEELAALKAEMASGGMDQANVFRGLRKSRFHRDFSTPEYRTYKEIRERKWEATRGIGHSFGYNRIETEEDMLTSKELIHMLVDVVSKNGNLLLNVGPMADGAIPEMQRKPLRDLGKWLRANGAAIYGTRPWQRAEGSTGDGLDVRFSINGDRLYATVLGRPRTGDVVLTGLRGRENTKITLLAQKHSLDWENQEGGIKIGFPSIPMDTPACSLEITPVPEDTAP
ncbi:MAG: alpha-L-fucosidase [Deltaproteobacteria bacterium]|nr:alpha-L-fucosidase [Deltaproteobacteria bacterium]